MLRSTLLKLSESKKFASWVTSNGTTRSMARRFVAGETLDEAIAAARQCNDSGMMASLDYLGENVSTTSDAQHSRDAYLEVFERIAQEKLHANVSCKLTQLGLDINHEFCTGLVLSIAERAASFDNFLRIDMEGSAYTQRTIDLVKRVRSRNPAVGTVIQAYLYRSQADVEMLCRRRVRVRLCKGAYLEPHSVAFAHKADVDRNYIHLMKILLDQGTYPAIATHDPRMIDATRKYADAQGLARDRFEFQMLYGIRRDLQRQLVAQGYRLRLYVPFGKAWYPYFMRRLAERPANVLFLLRNLLRK
jgi:proline dehydrogenase